MVNFKDQLQVLDSTYDHNFDIFEAYGFQSMLLMWYKQQLMALAIEHKLNNKDTHNSNSDSETKDVLEAICIILKYFTKHLYF